MNRKQKPFWKTKTLHKITDEEWESLCCRCGICCLHRLRSKITGKRHFTSVACKYLDTETCYCRIYENRFQIDPDCEKISPDNLMKLTWLPKTCGYRTIAEGRDLQWWHPLVSGNPDTVHKAGISVRNEEIVSEEDIVAGDLLKYMLIRPIKIFKGMK